MQPDRSVRPSPPGRSIDGLSLRCATALLIGLVGFGLLITAAKPLLSVFLFADVSVYLILILVLALAVWALTWFYMARLGAQESDQ